MSGRRAEEPRLPERFRAHLAAATPIRRDDVVLVALSGGLDSCALLHLLRFPLRDLRLRLFAGHVDHAMRAGSAADAGWVRGLCRAWELPLHLARLDPPARSEADGRDRRYDLLREMAAEVERETGRRPWVLTAHHLDDQAETVLFRAARGTGVRGLRGIAPRRGRLLRPLLPFRREELESYAAATGLRVRVDPTNREQRYARNRIRHSVLPALEAARPGAAINLARLADRARAAEAAWGMALRRLEEEVVVRESAAGATLARPVLHSYDPALRARVLRHLLRRYGSTPDRAGTRAALEFISSGPSGGELHLSGGVRLERDFDEIRIVASGTDDDVDEDLVVPEGTTGEGVARIGGRRFEVAWGRAPEEAGYRMVRVPDPVFPLTVRGWRPGDRIRLGYGTKKLKKLFVERRLDRHARRAAPVVVDGAGAVRWVVGLACAEGVGEDVEGFELAVRDAGQH